MGKFRSMVDMPERLVEFRRVYSIPKDVEVRYYLEFEVIFSRGKIGLSFP